MNKIFNKIFGIYLAVIIPLTGIILLLIFNIVHEHYLITITRDLKRLNYSIQDQVRPYVLEANSQELQQKIININKKIKARITIIDLKGVVLADSDENPKKMENHAGRIEIAKAMSGKMGSSLRHSVTVKKDMLYVALPLKHADNIIAVVRVSLYVDRIDTLYSELRNKILLITIIVIFISIVVLFFFSKNITDPIKELAAASSRFAMGDFNAKVFINNNDELKELADSFNLMTDKIKELFGNQSMYQEELQRILGSMQEGLVLLDKDNKIVMHNKSFRKTVNSDDINYRFYWEVLRDSEVQKLVDRVRKKRSRKTTEIELNNISYMCSANYIQTKDEIVLVLFDISERKQLEDMKRDFIVNASHELRTPLTAIHGFVETLEEETKGSYSKYLDVIKRHTTRLIAIVEDMLTVSKLEDDRLKTQISDIDFKKLIEDILTIFYDRIKEKKLKISYNISKETKTFKGDFFKIEQLFINLIDNAIKYTQSGEIKIRIDDEEDKVLIQVSDTGIGIEAQDLERIFERFYTVDKSRSKKSSGTGLGLSIVKHIVNLHKGSIDVSSSDKKGTTFSIRLPRES
ncbi:MAG: ATP-binding protein [bacterium]